MKPAAPGSTLTEIMSQTWAISARIVREYSRQRRNLIFWAVFPALMLLLFASIYLNNAGTASSFDNTPAGILIGAALFFSCLGGTVSLIVTERERRTLRRLLVSPLHPAAYFLGVTLACCAVAAAQTFVVYLIAWLIGARFHGSIALGVAIIALSVCAYVGLGFFFGARFAKRAEDVNGPVAALGVPLLVLGGTFFPITLLPAFLLKLAFLDPVFHMNQALKRATAGETWWNLRASLLFLLAFAALSILIGIASYRQMLTEEKRA